MHPAHLRPVAVRTALATTLLALVVGVAGSRPLPGAAADRYGRQIGALQAQAAQLRAQFRSLQQQENGAAAAAVAAQAELARTEASLADAQARLDRDNTALALTAAQIHRADERLARDRQQLTGLTVRLYEMGELRAVDALVDSDNMYRLIDTALQLKNVSGRFSTLVTRVRSERASLDSLRADQEREEQAAVALVNQLHSLQAQQAAEEERYREEVSALSGQAARVAAQSQAIVARIADLRAQQLASLRAAAARAAAGSVINDEGATPPFAFGPREDDFPWGQCTWYVASLRDVTWGGDAWEWLAGARAAGRPTGMTPRVGSIVVWGPGNGYSWYGHVAYVVAVRGPSDFIVDESNYFEVPGQLDRRWVSTLMDVEGFVYY